MILYSIKKVIITELDPVTEAPKSSGGVSFALKTAESCSLEALLSEGEEQVKRTDTEILAIASSEDLVYGYNLTFIDNKFSLNAAAFLGAMKEDKEGDTVKGVSSPMLSDGSANTKLFQMDIYSAQYQGTSIVGYAKITLAKCKGKAMNISIGKEFYAPEFQVKAREASIANKPCLSITTVEELPADPN